MENSFIVLLHLPTPNLCQVAHKALVFYYMDMTNKLLLGYQNEGLTILRRIRFPFNSVSSSFFKAAFMSSLLANSTTLRKDTFLLSTGSMTTMSLKNNGSCTQLRGKCSLILCSSLQDKWLMHSYVLSQQSREKHFLVMIS